MIPSTLEDLYELWWGAHVNDFDKSTTEGCGLHTEAWVKYAKANGFPKVENLKKNPGQTQYNGHAVDAFLYTDGSGNPNGLFSAVDIIGGAEGPNPTINFGVDTPRYTVADVWTGSNGGNPVPVPDTVPYVGYWGDPKSDKAMRTLMFDFFRRPENYNPGMGRWISRLIHSATIGPVPPSQGGQPLGFDGALNRHRPEWCQALGGLNPNTPVSDNFFPEWK